MHVSGRTTDVDAGRRSIDGRVVALALGLAATLVAGCISGTQTTSAPVAPVLTAAPTTVAAGPPSASPASMSPALTPALPSATAFAPTPALIPRWERIGPLSGPSLPAVSGVADLIGWDGGYVALLGYSSDRPARVLFSADAASWQAIDLPAPVLRPGLVAHGPAGLWDVTTDGRSVLVTGGQDHEPCGPTKTTPTRPCAMVPVSWITTDGIHWQASTPWMGPDEATIAAAWPMPGGWEAAVATRAYGEARTADAIYRSTDGRTWKQSESFDGPTHTADDVMPLDGIVAQDGTRLSSWFEWWDPDAGTIPEDSGVWVSRAPGSWDPVRSAAFGAGTETLLVGALTAPGPDAPRLWALGGLVQADGSIAVWTSPDLVDWTATRLAENPYEDGTPSGVTDLAATPLGLIAVDVQEQGVWLTRDGVAWEAVDSPRIAVVASGPAGVIGVDDPDDGTDATVWRLIP
jgi:hypothetical protein